jgi:NADPH-dependent stearoyl-CoA 9-desaturase
VRTICKLSLPNRFPTATSDDAPETASEARFRIVAELPRVLDGHIVGTVRRGLVTAIAERRHRATQ